VVEILADLMRINGVNPACAGGRSGARMRGRYVNHVRDPETRRLVETLQERMARLPAATGGDPRLAGQVTEDH